MSEMRVAVVGAWSTDTLGRKVKRLLVDQAISPEQVVSISHARSGLFAAAIGAGPLSALVVWRAS